MATAADYKDIILASIAAEPSLEDLSTSQVAEWVALINAISSAEFTMQDIWETYKEELNNLGLQINIGTPAWFADKALEYQDGDSLSVVDGKAEYLVIDISKRIIAQVAISESDEGRVVIKVVKASNVPLTVDELSRFTFYINRRKVAGVKTAFISQLADLVWPQMSVRYDGALVLADLKTAVETAINSYLANIYFDGKININLLRDAVEAVSGVMPGGVTITSLQLRPDVGSYVTVTYAAEAYSGHFKIDPAYPLSDDAQIHYIPV